ncbi:hypothetical protein M885DRAFT_240345 [Pelagophyceae sp. CCMP2097]|nr:hypothetical protein M885DRAFT_240345 [Pelagophyceae sp. CCMP2097]
MAPWGARRLLPAARFAAAALSPAPGLARRGVSDGRLWVRRASGGGPGRRASGLESAAVAVNQEITSCRTAADVLGVFERHGHKFNDVNTATALHRVATAAQRYRAAAAERAANTPADGAAASTADARLASLTADVRLEALTALAAKRQRAWQPRHVANAVWAAAKLPGESWS